MFDFLFKKLEKTFVCAEQKLFELPLTKNFIIIRTKLLCMGKSTLCGTKTGLMSVGHVSIVKIFCQICKNSMCIFCRVILSLNRHFLIRSCATWFFRDSFGIFDIEIYPRSQSYFTLQQCYCHFIWRMFISKFFLNWTLPQIAY